VKRIVVTGSESTGKSELARKLAQHFDAELVPEFVREFAEARNGVITFADHGPIARGQIELEDRHAEAAKREGRLVIQDTDLLSTVVYCEHYFGGCPEWIVQAASERRPDLYLLCEIDVPWVADPVRDRGHMREEMQSLFRAATAASGAPVAVVEGSWDSRWATAVASVKKLLGGRNDVRFLRDKPE
jgi:NadR type nicotinamide-nucleotide adenylyltransferase